MGVEIKMKWLDRIFDKMMPPLNYEQGYIDGFAQGLKFYKESIDMMHKAVLDSKQVQTDMRAHAKKLREETEKEQDTKLAKN
jgi:hypothetical protein